MEKFVALSQQEYDRMIVFSSIKSVFEHYMEYGILREYYGLKKNSTGFTQWKYVEKAFRECRKKPNYDPGTIYIVF